MFFDVSAFFAFVAAFLVGILFNQENLKGRIVSVANLCSLTTVALSLIFLAIPLARGAGARQMEPVTKILLLMNLYACLFNFAARAWAALSRGLKFNAGKTS
jgi:hypothetical protein